MWIWRVGEGWKVPPSLGIFVCGGPRVRYLAEVWQCVFLVCLTHINFCLFLQLLLLAVGNHLRNQGALRRMTTPLDVSLLYTLWVLANPDTFRSSGSQFGKAPSTVFHHYSAIIKALCELRDQFIKWPCAAERAIIRREFEQNYGYPGVVGNIDGTFCTITAPLEQKQAYITRHHTHAFIAQAVCDHNLLYRDVFLGMPGRVGDLRTFEESPLFETLLRNPDVMDEDEHILGDGAYPISKHVSFP